MSKLLEIDNCNYCKYIGEGFRSDKYFPIYFAKCKKKNRKIKTALNDGIPSWCPLPDADK